MTTSDDPHFVPLPSDPRIPLTPEQLNALFPVSDDEFCRILSVVWTKVAPELQKEVTPAA